MIATTIRCLGALGAGMPGGLGQDRGARRLSRPRAAAVRHRRRQLHGGGRRQMPVEGADQPPGLPGGCGFGVGAGPPRDAGEIPPRPDPRRAPCRRPEASANKCRSIVSAHFIGHMQPDSLGQVMHASSRWPQYGASPMASIPLRDNPSRSRSRFRIARRVHDVAAQYAPAPRRGVALQRPAQPKHRSPLPLQTPANPLGRLTSSSRRITATGPAALEVRALRLASPPRPPLPHRW